METNEIKTKTQKRTPKRSKYRFVYDVEVFVNFFSIVLYEVDMKVWREYYFFAGDPWPENTDVLLDTLGWSTLVGYNNLHFDSYLLFMLDFSYRRGESTEQATAVLHALSSSIINNGWMGNHVKRLECCLEIDLKKLLRLHRSLKWYSFNMGNVDNAEYTGDFTKPLPREKLRTLLDYNKNDVSITADMLNRYYDNIEVRYSIYDKYGSSNNRIFNMDNSTLGAYIIYKSIGASSAYTNEGLKHIFLSINDDILFDVAKDYTWHTPVLEKAFKTIGSTTLEYPVVSESDKYMRNSQFHDTSEDKKLSISAPLMNSEVKFGVGGLHYAIPFSYYDPSRNKEDEDKLLIAIDVTSYYPSLIKNHSLLPHGCDAKFLYYYAEMLRHRKQLPKESMERYSYKIALNSVFGKMRQVGSIFYDQRAFLQVVVNGQVLLTQMIDELLKEGYEVVCANTDGIFVRLPKHRKEELGKTIDGISARTSLGFDRIPIEKLYLRDCNNFTSQGYGDKGWYVINATAIDANSSNHASRVAARSYLLDGTPIGETLRSLWYEGRYHLFCFCFSHSHAIRKVMFGDREVRSKLYIYYNVKHGDCISLYYNSGSKRVHVGTSSQLIMGVEDMDKEPDFSFYESIANKNIYTFFTQQSYLLL